MTLDEEISKLEQLVAPEALIVAAIAKAGDPELFEHFERISLTGATYRAKLAALYELRTQTYVG